MDNTTSILTSGTSNPFHDTVKPTGGRVPFTFQKGQDHLARRIRLRALQGLNGELGLRQIENVLRLTEQLQPAVLGDVLLALYRLGLVRPPPGSHDKFLRIRGDGIPGEEGIHPRAPVPQHDPNAVHPNLEKQQVAHVRLAVPLRAQLVGTLHISLRVPPSSRSVTNCHESAASTVSNTPRDSTK